MPTAARRAPSIDTPVCRLNRAARAQEEQREARRNPPNLVDCVPEVVEGYLDRMLSKSEAAAKELRTRTLTDLYNRRPAWLDNAHRSLDAAIVGAYPPDLQDAAVQTVLQQAEALASERAV